MRRAVILDLAATQQRAVKPDGASKLDHAWVYNPSDGVVYLNIWDDLAVSGSPSLDIADVDDQIVIPSLFAGVVYLEFGASGSVVVSASTAAAGTGAPSEDVAISLRWT